MKTKNQNWLIIGVPKNWETALSQPMPIWGLKSRYQAEFQNMNIGDILWFYSTSPVGGIIGMGALKDKYVDNANLVWEEELKQKEVIWPLRFRIHVLKILPKIRWKTDKVRINDFNLFWQIGFHLLKEEQARELFKRSEKIFGAISKEKLFTGATISEPLLIREKLPLYIPREEKLTITHRELQERVAEIGKLQFYYTEVEYPIELPGENKSLDAVWKREIDGSPTFAFEIELSGMIEKAVERLKFSFRKWNSRPRIIVPKEIFKKVHNILVAGDKDFSSQIKLYEPVQIVELLNRKRELKIMEQNLDLY